MNYGCEDKTLLQEHPIITPEKQTVQSGYSLVKLKTPREDFKA
jgi:hypothetical protein